MSVVPKVTYVHTDGVEQAVQGSTGTTIMQTAVARGVDGIVGECGGNLMCATCHVYVDEQWVDKLPIKSEDEDELLDETTSPRESNSRLCCQLVLDDALDGVVVRLPDRQI
jgi:2Fe-2S ferredoxin